MLATRYFRIKKKVVSLISLVVDSNKTLPFVNATNSVFYSNNDGRKVVIPSISTIPSVHNIMKFRYVKYAYSISLCEFKYIKLGFISFIELLHRRKQDHYLKHAFSIFWKKKIWFVSLRGACFFGRKNHSVSVESLPLLSSLFFICTLTYFFIFQEVHIF